MAKLNWANNSGSTSVIIPISIMKQLDWKRGDDVVFVVKDKQLVIKNLKDID